MEILSVRGRPHMADAAIAFFQRTWGTEDNRMMYEDCIRHSLTARGPLPQWYLLLDGENVAGGAGLIPNDFISRMDLWPWICSLYVEEPHRGRQYGRLLLEKAREDARRLGFSHVYLCTEHTGYYERYGFTQLGAGYHPWGGSSSIYAAAL